MMDRLARNPRAGGAVWIAVAVVLGVGSAARAQVGACCIRDLAGTCADGVTDLECSNMGGEYRGDGTTCAGVGGCLGACCTHDGACTNAVSKEDCDQLGALNGVFQGYGTHCGGVECPTLDGACCLPDGSCVILSLNNCLANVNAKFNGVGTLCADFTCDVACCLPDGTCVDGISYDACCNPGGNNGISLGYDETCASVGGDCPGAGACCIPGVGCQNELPADCFAMGGCYQGDGTDCTAPYDCGPHSVATGACLDPDGFCLGVMTECDCLLNNDYVFNDYYYWGGAGSTCGSLPHMNFEPGGGQVVIAGATLFADFAEIAGAANDFDNVDGDLNLQTGFPLSRLGVEDSGECAFPTAFERLAPLWVCPGQPGNPRWWGRWLVTYRSVGSLNGVNEFIDWHLLGQVGIGTLTERGVLNAERYNVGGVATGPGLVCPADCFPGGDLNASLATDGLDVQPFVDELLGFGGAAAPQEGDFNGDGLVTIDDVGLFINCLFGDCGVVEPSSPVCVTSVDMGSTDVPLAWVVRLPGPTAWNRKPTLAGYGENENMSWDTGFSQKLVSVEREHPVLGTVSLNTDIGNPDDKTIFDNIVAYSPVALIANQGTGLENVKFSQAQHHFVTGRLRSGENLVGATRDAGSGTRNACMNSLGIDPSWGAGDHLGDQSDTSANSQLGPTFQPTNNGGSSRMEDVVRHSRLAWGYTGLFGGSRAAVDAAGGNYEILNVMKDTSGGSQFVRPTLNAVLDNADVNTGFQIGGMQTVATRGDVAANAGPTLIDNPAVIDYMRNLLNSIAGFAATPFTNINATPAQALSIVFTLPASVDAIPAIDDPTDYSGGNPGFSQDAQDAVRAINTTVVPAFGSVNPHGDVPLRRSGFAYSDGSPSNAYRDAAGTFTLGAGTNLSTRMHIQGDFNADGARNWLDIDELMAAINNPAAFQAADVGGNPGNYLIPEILGDFDGDGNFGDNTLNGGVGTNAITADEMADARYFADGLAVDPATGKLNRAEGFTRVDIAWEAIHAGDFNFFNTALATGAAYAAGDARGDVAGNAPSPGAKPTGADGVINAVDVDYVCANFVADWTDLDQVTAGGFVRDLSCDVDGDCDVDCDDVMTLVVTILKTTLTDLNLDGAVNQPDKDVVCANLGLTPACWSQGDVNCDGAVDQDDLDLVAADAGLSNTCP